MVLLVLSCYTMEGIFPYNFKSNLATESKQIFWSGCSYLCTLKYHHIILLKLKHMHIRLHREKFRCLSLTASTIVFCSLCLILCLFCFYGRTHQTAFLFPWLKFIHRLMFHFRKLSWLNTLILLYTCVDVPEAAFFSQMLTLEILHVCRQIDEYTHLIASIKAQIKLVRTMHIIIV
jgi:hypothetical protein